MCCHPSINVNRPRGQNTNLMLQIVLKFEMPTPSWVLILNRNIFVDFQEVLVEWEEQKRLFYPNQSQQVRLCRDLSVQRESLPVEFLMVFSILILGKHHRVCLLIPVEMKIRLEKRGNPENHVRIVNFFNTYQISECKCCIF